MNYRPRTSIFGTSGAVFRLFSICLALSTLSSRMLFAAGYDPFLAKDPAWASERCSILLSSIANAFASQSIPNENVINYYDTLIESERIFIFHASTYLGGTKQHRSLDEKGFDKNSHIHFMALSNYFDFPLNLICPADNQKRPAASSARLRPENVTYQLRTDDTVTEMNPTEVLAQCPIHGHTVSCSGTVIKATARNAGEKTADNSKATNPSEISEPLRSSSRSNSREHEQPQQSRTGRIRDVDLAKITRLIQEGKTARAQAEISILLDDNPNDPNASKLRKILDSLEGGPSAPRATSPQQKTEGAKNATQSASENNRQPVQNDGPSKEATIAWIDKNIYATHTWELNSDHKDEWIEKERVVAFDIHDGSLRIAIEATRETEKEARSAGDNTTSYQSRYYRVYRVALTDLYLGGSSSSLREAYAKHPGGRVSLRSEFGRSLWFGSKENAVQVLEISLSEQWDRWTGPPRGSAWLRKINHNEVSSAAYSSARNAYDKWMNSAGEGRFHLPQDLAWKSETKTSGLSIPVSDSLGERMKSALEHLIKLSGGSEKPKEAF